MQNPRTLKTSFQSYTPLKSHKTVFLKPLKLTFFSDQLAEEELERSGKSFLLQTRPFQPFSFPLSTSSRPYSSWNGAKLRIDSKLDDDKFCWPIVVECIFDVQSDLLRNDLKYTYNLNTYSQIPQLLKLLSNLKISQIHTENLPATCFSGNGGLGINKNLLFICSWSQSKCL